MSTRGALVMLLSGILFAVMGVLIRLCPVNAYITVMMRFAIGVATVAGLFALGYDRPRWTNWQWIVIRGLAGGLAVVLFYWTIQHLGLAKASLLAYTYTVFAPMLAIPLLGEKISGRHWAAIAVALAGIALLCDASSLHVSRGDLLGLSGGFLSGVAVVSVAKCRATDSSANIFWSQSWFGLLMIAWPTVRHWQTPTPGQWGLLVAIGLLAAAGQLAMTYAYKYTGATNGSLFALVTPVLGAFFGLVVFREPLAHGALLGMVLILSACAYLALDPVRSA